LESIERFRDDENSVWSRRAKAEMIERNCWNAVEPSFSEDMNQDQLRVNKKALAFLSKHVADSYVEDIGECERARDAWESLERIHSS